MGARWAIRTAARVARVTNVHRPGSLALVLVATGCAGAPASSARSADLQLVVAPSTSTATWSASAREAYTAGVAAAQAQQWDEAVRQFRASLRQETHTETLL